MLATLTKVSGVTLQTFKIFDEGRSRGRNVQILGRASARCISTGRWPCRTRTIELHRTCAQQNAERVLVLLVMMVRSRLCHVSLAEQAPTTAVDEKMSTKQKTP